MDITHDIKRRRKIYEQTFFVQTVIIYDPVKVQGQTSEERIKYRKGLGLKCSLAPRPSRELRDFNPEHILQTGGQFMEFSVKKTLDETCRIFHDGKFFSIRNILNDDVAALSKIALLDIIPTVEIDITE